MNAAAPLAPVAPTTWFDITAATHGLGDTPEASERRARIGRHIRNLHGRGWSNPFSGEDNPMDGAEAIIARSMLAKIEAASGSGWEIVVALAIRGDRLWQAAQIVTEAKPAHRKEAAIKCLCDTLDWLGAKFPELTN